MTRWWILVLGCLLANVGSVQATTWYVQSDRGDANGDGRSPEHAWNTIQRAADAVQPGDTVVIGRGVYYEHVQVHAKGTARQPITFKADQTEKGRVTVTGADPDVHRHKVPWTLEDPALGLYSIPWAKPRPARVLYSGADLYPYLSLEHLRLFMAVNLANRKHRGPQHGVAFDQEKHRLYVRLHASGKYGPSDPNRHAMSISGPTGGGSVGLTVTDSSQYNLGILGRGDAHIVVEGMTFEAGSVAGVYTEANDVTVRDCWFIGCRSGVGGTSPYDRPEPYSSENVANRVVVEYCFFTQYPTYEDGCETIRLTREAGDKELPFWHRKDVNSGLPDAKLNYEVGLVSLAGRDWILRHNHVWDAFEALSSRATNNSENLHIYENLFEKLLDNAVETEDHASNIHIYRNVIRDTFVPISWQPLEAKPWPGPVFCYQNVIYNYPEHAALFAFRHPPVFKIGATEAKKRYGKDYVAEIPDPGLVIFNNTVFFDGLMFWGALEGHHPDKVKFYNNILVLELNMPRNWRNQPVYLELANNLCAPFPESKCQDIAGLEGQLIPDYRYKVIGMKNPLAQAFELAAGSPALGKAVPILKTPVQFQDIGAFQQGDHWYPPAAGPRVSATGGD